MLEDGAAPLFGEIAQWLSSVDNEMLYRYIARKPLTPHTVDIAAQKRTVIFRYGDYRYKHQYDTHPLA